MSSTRGVVLALLVLLAMAACSSTAATSAPSGSAATSAPSGGPPSGNVLITARGLRFVPVTVDVPAAKAFKIDFDNQDAATIHDIDIHRNGAGGELVFDGPSLSGPARATYEIPALSAGTYAFVCSIHPSDMTGTMAAK